MEKSGERGKGGDTFGPIHGVQRLASDSVFIRPSRASCRDLVRARTESCREISKRERKERLIDATVIYNRPTESRSYLYLTDILQECAKLD